MKKLFILLLAASTHLMAGIPDTVSVRPMAPSDGSGLFLEWSADGHCWTSVTRRRILSSDYGGWGSGKKLYNPSLSQDRDGLYVLVFQPSDRANQFGVSTTRDFIHWRPQDYPYMQGVGQCIEPVVVVREDAYVVTFHNRAGQYFMTRSRDMIHFTAPVAVSEGQASEPLRVPYTCIQALGDNQQAFLAREALHNELARDNEERFRDVKDVRAELHIDFDAPKTISDKLMGIFFEDINYSADGGLNAQLIQNGDFEYDPHDRRGDKDWNQLTAWKTTGNGGQLIIDVEGVSPNNCHAVALDISELGRFGAMFHLENEGFDGIPVKAKEKYDLSLYLKGGKVRVSLMDGEFTMARVVVQGSRDEWKQAKAVLKPFFACENPKDIKLQITPLEKGVTAIDMVSLIPQDTYKGHGLRRDLAETLEALHPRFMRFPGGCVTHGDGIDNIYHWKETIGPLKDRKPLRNIWGYHQSRQLGFYEFFQMCEDMGMEPLPVLAAGVPCQNSGDGGSGQQGGIPMEEMSAYVQEILDLIEWANGDASTEWGRKRAEQGHKKPFGLKYLGIGNEDLISPTFEERYLMICKAVKEKYPDIVVCGTVGPFYYGSDYEEGWRIAMRHSDIIDMVDEHYYLPPSWYIYNQDYYDHYDRTAPKVYLGEWAAHVPGRKSTIETALCEALHYCNLERNGDVVEMSSYAPLLAREGHTQWNPDMIYFNATEVHPTVGYFAQVMCGKAQGTQYLPSVLTVNSNKPGVKERVAASIRRDEATGTTYVKLVNVLNKPVTLSGLTSSALLQGRTMAKRTVLTGAFDSTTARPQEDTITLVPDEEYELPAYSFTLIEL